MGMSLCFTTGGFQKMVSDETGVGVVTNDGEK